MVRLDEALRLCTGRLEGAGTSGTGFFVGPGLVLTCGHVVAPAILAAGESTGESIGEPGTSAAAMTLHWQGQSVAARVTLVLPPPVPNQASASYPYPDLALLGVALEGHPCVLLTDEGPPLGEELYAYGYTDEYPEGDSALFVYEGPSDGDNPLLRLKESQARPGLSGAPLVSATRQAVVGIVKRSRDKATALGGRAIPAATILAQMPDLASIQKAFHGTDHRWPADRRPVLTPAERQHKEKLLATHQRNAAVYEEQIAKFGPAAPVYIVTGLADEREAIATLMLELGAG